MYQKILVPLDGSELAECVLPHVEAIAKTGGVKNVTFVRVADTFFSHPTGGGGEFSEEYITKYDTESKAAAEKYLNQLVSRLNYGKVKIQAEVLTGKAAETLTDYATKNKVDLIIIATHGRSGVSRWVMGSVADRLLRSACAPVLMVRAPGCIPGI
ncbi:MAG: universal stress protein [Dehalococcoidales bacterium]